MTATGTANRRDTHDTKRHLIDVAYRLFAVEGYRAVSIARIASQLGITKQALLHHFPRKEKLFAAVMEELGQRLVATADALTTIKREKGRSALDILKEGSRAYFERHPLDAHLVAHELLAQHAHIYGQERQNRKETGAKKTWYLRPYLDRLTDFIATDPQFDGQSRIEVFAAVYSVIGEVNFFVISETTLRGIYGDDDFAAVSDAFYT